MDEKLYCLAANMCGSTIEQCFKWLESFGITFKCYTLPGMHTKSFMRAVLYVLIGGVPSVFYTRLVFSAGITAPNYRESLRSAYKDLCSYEADKLKKEYDSIALQINRLQLNLEDLNKEIERLEADEYDAN